MTIEMIPFKNFKEKIKITKQYDFIAKMEIIDNKYVYVKMKEAKDENKTYTSN